MDTAYNREIQEDAVAGYFSMSSESTLMSMFRESVVRHGFKTAVVCGGQRMTYAELNRAANRMAGRLAKLSVAHGHLAAIYVDRSVDMIVALVAVLKLGAAYVPIDPGYPQKRVLETLADCRPSVLITTQALAAKLPKELGHALTIVPLDIRVTSELDGSSNPPSVASDEDVAYVIYTSGSTGKPKGVRVSHRNLARLVEQTQPWFHFSEKDVWTMFHSLAFDFSVWEIWGCLLTGGRLVIVPFDVSRSPEEFYLMLADERVTVLNQTPSAFSLLMQAEEGRTRLPLSLRLVIFGGEALYPRHLRAWFERHGETMPQLINMYGITETTVHVSYRPMTSRDAEAEMESLIGVPIPDMEIHLLDDAGKAVPDGTTGEMYVGGGGVSLGYLNRPTLNAQRFVQDRMASPGVRLYRTGDLARRREDGELVYLGRIDGQVKINGFRIELGEVESALASFPQIQHSCVTTLKNGDGSLRLVAHYVVRKEATVSISALREFLGERLPSHMLPSSYVQIDTMPLTGNGKIDRAALPPPDKSAHGSTTMEEPAPISAMEQKISAVWKEVLGLDEVGLNENFFDVGGTSLLLIKVRTQLQQTLDRAIPVTWMFEWTTVRALAQRLDVATAAPPATAEQDMDEAQSKAKKQRDAFARFRGKRGGAQ